MRVGFLGVKPEYQHTGVAAKLYQMHFDAAEVRPQKGGEMGWILETNTAMNRGMEAMGGKIVKRYRVYERDPRRSGSALRGGLRRRPRFGVGGALYTSPGERPLRAGCAAGPRRGH